MKFMYVLSDFIPPQSYRNKVTNLKKNLDYYTYFVYTILSITELLNKQHSCTNHIGEISPFLFKKKKLPHHTEIQTFGPTFLTPQTKKKCTLLSLTLRRCILISINKVGIRCCVCCLKDFPDIGNDTGNKHFEHFEHFKVNNLHRSKFPTFP
jgi:hypothetical protein